MALKHSEEFSADYVAKTLGPRQGMSLEMKQVPTLERCDESCEACYAANHSEFRCPNFKIIDTRLTRSRFTLIVDKNDPELIPFS